MLISKDGCMKVSCCLVPCIVNTHTQQLEKLVVLRGLRLPSHCFLSMANKYVIPLQIINVLAMKENGSENSTVLNRDWVLKRKRRKLPSGTDKSCDRGKIFRPVKFSSTTRLNNDQEEDDNLDKNSGKRKGNDGVS